MLSESAMGHYVPTASEELTPESRFGAISKMTVTNAGMGGNAARHFGAASVEAVPTRAF